MATRMVTVSAGVSGVDTPPAAHPVRNTPRHKVNNKMIVAFIEFQTTPLERLIVNNWTNCIIFRAGICQHLNPGNDQMAVTAQNCISLFLLSFIQRTFFLLFSLSLTQHGACATLHNWMSPQFKQITIVIPTFNEAGNLPGLVQAIFALPIANLTILVVDDGSPDGTGELAQQLALQYSPVADPEAVRMKVLRRSGKLGLGSAYLEGFQAAFDWGADVVGQMDADFSHAPEKLLELVDALEDSDLVLGSRYVPGGSVDRQWPAWRKALSAFGNFYATTILNLPVRDATGGFRLWRSAALASLPLDRVRSNGYGFLVELTYLASRMGLRITEVPIYFADRSWGSSKMSFKIQREAALGVWQMLWEHRGVRGTK